MRYALVLAVFVFVAGIPADAADPGARCSSARLKVAAKKANTKLKCHAKANARGVPVDSECLTKAEQKFSQTWQRIEAGGGCRTSTLTESDVELRVDAFVSQLAVSLAPCGEIDGVCGGTCPFGLNCFEIGTGCFGEAEPCRCHGSTTTCQTTSSTTTTVP